MNRRVSQTAFGRRTHTGPSRRVVVQAEYRRRRHRGRGDPAGRRGWNLSGRVRRGHRIIVQRMGRNLQPHRSGASGEGGSARVTSALTGIDAKIDSRCLTAALNKQGCEVGSEGLPALRRVIDMDHPNAPVERARKCDYLLLAEESNPRRLLVMPSGRRARPRQDASKDVQGAAQEADSISFRRISDHDDELWRSVDLGARIAVVSGRHAAHRRRHGRRSTSWSARNQPPEAPREGAA